MILELKISDTIQGMEKKCEEALTQIEEQKYESSLEEDCFQPILKYAICFFKKRMHGKESGITETKTQSLRRECEEMNEAVKKKISIGVEDFKELIDKDGYFVDKTLMIEKLIESNAMVTLFTRPRRFGKTLNQFMIRRFFEDERTEKGAKVDNGYLFDGLKIAECGEEILSHSAAVSGDFPDFKVSEAADIRNGVCMSCGRNLQGI